MSSKAFKQKISLSHLFHYYHHSTLQPFSIALAAIPPLHAPSPTPFLLPAMVHYSDKQVILNDIVCTLKLSIPAEVIQNTNRVQHSCSTDINNLDDNGDPIPLSQHLVCLYTFICKQRYTITCCTPLGHANKLIHLLNRYESSNHRMFHGLVHMSPEAFNNLAIRLQQTEAFWWNYSSSGVMSLNKVQEILSVALYRLGHSGNGGGECDAALQCGCGVGSIVGYTNHTVAGLLKLNNKVMQFASEGERQHASAWVCNTTGVEEWGMGWLVVDGTHIPLAWKPGVLSREHFCYKGFHSINVALVILPHSLRIVESVVGQPGSVQDSKVWASGSNILKKPCLYLDEGEFIWVDGGYGHSAFTVGPFSHIAANKS